MIEKALRHYLLSKQAIRNLVGNHIYAGRIPQGEKPITAIVLTRSSARRFYDLGGEDGLASPVIEAEFVAKGKGGERRAFDAFEQVRLAISSYRGNMGAAHESIYVSGCTIESDFMPEPVLLPASGTWTYTYSATFRITHAQTAVAAL